IHFSPCCQVYGSWVAPDPDKHASTAGFVTQFPWPTYYWSATRPSTPRSSPGCLPRCERIFLLLPRSGLSAASSSAVATACSVFRSDPIAPPALESVIAYSAHGSRMKGQPPDAFAAGIPEGAQYESATVANPRTSSSNCGYTTHTFR